jgi:putative membrane protein insertion efficiency factor
MSRVRAVLWAAGVPVRLALVGLIRVYQLTLSGWLGQQCRFYPSCSHYAAEAIQRHGAVRGVGLAAWRLARCGPFTPGGVDHVPAPRRERGLYDAVIPKGSAQ